MAAARFVVVARTFKTSSAHQQLVKPPVQVFGIDGRYACALYSAASKLKQLPAVEKELVKFQQQMKTDLKFKEFIQNPTLKRQLKSDALKQVATKLSLSPPTANLVTLLAENGRLKHLNGVINAFKIIMAAERGEVPCEVITATALDEPTSKELEAALKGHLKNDQKLLLNVKVDPSIIGGMIISIGDKYVDMSTVSKIKRYTDIISAAV